ncbi:MAG: transcription termination factor NusA [bacterium]
MANEFESAINQICEEKNISKERVIETIEAALAAAFRKDYGKKGQNVRVKMDIKTGVSKVYEIMEVVEEVEDEQRELTLKDAKKIKKTAKIGDEIKTDITPETIDFGRIAAQTAKQVITQRIKEAERDAVFAEFEDKEGEVLTGTVQRIEGGNVFVDLGPAVGVMFPSEQIDGERYNIGQRIKVYLNKVSASQKGPEILLSRSHPKLVEKLFSMEVPEITAGTVELKSVAREAGSRSKIAVASTTPEIDPVGSCVGQRGTRVQTVISEINGEKIDIIEWDENPVKFISNALSPAKVTSVQLNEKEKHAKVEVPEDQLSLVIGKSGQNVRLAVRLTGWKIDIIRDDGEEVAVSKKTKDSEGVEIKEEAIKGDPSTGSGQDKKDNNKEDKKDPLTDSGQVEAEAAEEKEDKKKEVKVKKETSDKKQETKKDGSTSSPQDGSTSSPQDGSTSSP